MVTSFRRLLPSYESAVLNSEDGDESTELRIYERHVSELFGIVGHRNAARNTTGLLIERSTKDDAQFMVRYEVINGCRISLHQPIEVVRQRNTPSRCSIDFAICQLYLGAGGAAEVEGLAVGAEPLGGGAAIEHREGWAR